MFKALELQLNTRLERGAKRYELSNHLGNVLTVISDKKTAICTGNTFNYFAAERISATDYSPFGATLAGRTWQASEYRFGFNSMEKVNEINGIGNAYDFGARIYDARIGRWMSVDPLTSKRPNWTPYVYCANNPILYVDLDGNDWAISVGNDGNGNIIINMTLTAAVLNTSSNTRYANKQISEVINQQVTETFCRIFSDGKSTVKVNIEVKIRPIESVDKLAENEHLFEIVDDKFLPHGENSNGYAPLYGKHIMIGQSNLISIMTQQKNNLGAFNQKTIPHELGHTLGLIHPFESFNYFQKLFLFDTEIERQLDQPEKEDKENAMNYEDVTKQKHTSLNQIRIAVTNFIKQKLNKNNIDKDEIKKRETDN